MVFRKKRVFEVRYEYELKVGLMWVKTNGTTLISAYNAEDVEREFGQSYANLNASHARNHKFLEIVE